MLEAEADQLCQAQRYCWSSGATVDLNGGRAWRAAQVLLAPRR